MVLNTLCPRTTAMFLRTFNERQYLKGLKTEKRLEQQFHWGKWNTTLMVVTLKQQQQNDCYKSFETLVGFNRK